MNASAPLDLVFGEDLLDTLERLVQSRLRLRSIRRDFGPAGGKHMFVLHLRVGWVKSPELRHGRAQHTLLDIGDPVWVVLGVEPPRVVLYDRRHRRNSPGKADL